MSWRRLNKEQMRLAAYSSPSPQTLPFLCLKDERNQKIDLAPESVTNNEGNSLKEVRCNDEKGIVIDVE
ncbi:MAG: hypothetical protein WCD28_14005 [Nitrososphaeraceae archaeon]